MESRNISVQYVDERSRMENWNSDSVQNVKVIMNIAETIYLPMNMLKNLNRGTIYESGNRI